MAGQRTAAAAERGELAARVVVGRARAAVVLRVAEAMEAVRRAVAVVV